MELVLNNNFDEINLEEINGGVNWGQIVAGTTLIVGVAGLTIATGGIGTASVGLLLGAGTGSELTVAGLACFGSAVGGGAIGSAF